MSGIEWLIQCMGAVSSLAALSPCHLLSPMSLFNTCRLRSDRIPLRLRTRATLSIAIGISLLGGCAAPKFTVDDGRPVNPELLANIQAYGQGEQALRPAIARSAQLSDADCSRQWELPIAVATSQQWAETDRVAWVRALKVDERPTVIAVAPGTALQPGDKLVDIDGTASTEAEKMLKQLADMRDQGRPFPVRTAAGQTVKLVPFEVCRGYTRLAPPNTPELQEYHWLMSYHPLQVAKADLTEEEALWTVLWTQGMSEEGGARMKTYHYGTQVIGSLYTLATIASGLKGAAMAAEAAVATAQKAAATVASDLIRQQLIEQAKQFGVDRIRDQLAKSAQQLTQAQVVASMQQVAANKGLLGGVSRVAATVFDRADTWAYQRMKRLGADPLAGFALHQKMLERQLLSNALPFDPERMASLQAVAQQDGRGEDVVAVLKGIRPETLNFDTGDMPLASAPTEFSYEDPVARDASPYAQGLIEAMLGTPENLLPGARR